METEYDGLYFADGKIDMGRVGMIDDYAVSSDGRFAYFSDRTYYRIRCVDGDLKTITTVAGDGRHMDTCGPALSSSLCCPDAICVDSTTAIPNSVLYFGVKNQIRKIQLEQRVSDLLLFHLHPFINYWLIRDLWSIVAEYAVEPAHLSTISTIINLAWAIITLPSNHLLVAATSTSLNTSLSIFTIDLTTGQQSTIIAENDYRIGYIRGFALHEPTNSVYFNDTLRNAIRKIKLPHTYFKTRQPTFE